MVSGMQAPVVSEMNIFCLGRGDLYAAHEKENLDSTTTSNVDERGQPQPQLVLSFCLFNCLTSLHKHLSCQISKVENFFLKPLYEYLKESYQLFSK